MTQNAVTVSPKRPVSLNLDSAELAATYDEVSVRQFNHGKILIAELGLKSGERVLDIGCGTGRLGAYVADLVAPQGEVLGIDPLPLRIDLAARKNPRFKASVGRAEESLRVRRREFRRRLREQRLSLGRRQAQGAA